jgi:thiamine transport system permease protein
MRWVLPGVAGATFMLCFASFAVVLTLGGGPWATTIDVAIYQALRLEFDIARAVTLAGVQLTACLLLSAVLQDQVLWRAAGRSASVALLAGALSLALGLSLLHGARVLRAQHGRVGLAGAMELLGLLPLITLPLMLATGLFMLLRPYVDVLAVGLYLTIVVNALMGLPFVLSIVAPAMRRADRESSRLCLDLGIRGWDRFRLVD